MRMLMMPAVVALVFFCGTGCATLARGDKQTMKFMTEPTGATVSVSDGKSERKITTPSELDLKRKDKYQVAVSKDGYRTVNFELVAQWDGAAIGNVVLPGGSIGAATDRTTGADLQFYKLDTIKLTPATAGATEPIKMIQHRGHLYTDEQYKKVLQAEIEYQRSLQQLN